MFTVHPGLQGEFVGPGLGAVWGALYKDLSFSVQNREITCENSCTQITCLPWAQEKSRIGSFLWQGRLGREPQRQLVRNDISHLQVKQLSCVTKLGTKAQNKKSKIRGTSFRNLNAKRIEEIYPLYENLSYPLRKVKQSKIVLHFHFSRALNC